MRFPHLPIPSELVRFSGVGSLPESGFRDIMRGFTAPNVVFV
jgi:hypothetical protein